MALILLNLKSIANHNGMDSNYELIKSLVPEDVVGQVIIRIGDYKRSKRPSKTEPSIILEDPF